MVITALNTVYLQTWSSKDELNEIIIIKIKVIIKIKKKGIKKIITNGKSI